jgi:hypothetical protein
MKSRAKVARACVAFAVGLSCYPVEAESPNRRTGGPSRRSSEKEIYKTTQGALLWSDTDAKSALEPHCLPIHDASGVNGSSPALDARGKKEVEMRIRAAGIALDRAERHAAEWGHASIASAVLVETHSESNRFSIEANTSYEIFANAARKGRQGGASRYIEETLKAKLEGQFGSSTKQEREDKINELDQQKRYAEKQYELEVVERRLKSLRNIPLGPLTPQVPEDPADPGLPAGTEKSAAEPDESSTKNEASPDLLPPLPVPPGAEGDTTNVFVNSSFSPQQATLKTQVPAQATDDTPNLTELALLADHLQPSEGDVMKTAASNLVTQKILNYLTKPVKVGSDHVPWFMVTQVSVSPGSRTFRDYAAETTLHPYYARPVNGKLVVQKDPGTVHPGIFAAFPLVEAQALDLRNSERYETQLSLAIAAKLLTAGKQTEAKFYL